MVEFPSQNWNNIFMIFINHSFKHDEEYKDASKDWQGTLRLIITPDGKLKKTYVIYLELWYGKCRAAKLLSAQEGVMAEISIEGPYSLWKKLFTRKKKNIPEFIRTKFRVIGNPIKIVTGQSLASKLVGIAQQIQTEFL